VFKAHRWLYHSTLGLRVIKKKMAHRSLRCATESPSLLPPLAFASVLCVHSRSGVPRRARS